MPREPELKCEKKRKHSEEVYECKLINTEEAVIILPEDSNFMLYGREGQCFAQGMIREPAITHCKDLYNGILSFNYSLTREDIEEILQGMEE